MHPVSGPLALWSASSQPQPGPTAALGSNSELKDVLEPSELGLVYTTQHNYTLLPCCPHLRAHTRQGALGLYAHVSSSDALWSHLLEGAALGGLKRHNRRV